jgi:hypothetical protein
MMSGALPAAALTTILTGFSGQACAAAGRGNWAKRAREEATTVCIRSRRFTCMSVSGHGRSVWRSGGKTRADAMF